MSRPYRKHLSIYIPEDMHAELKLIAKNHNVTITTYLIRLLYKDIQQNRKRNSNDKID